MVPSDYFVYESAHFNPWIKLILFLDSAQGGLLRNVQNHFSRHLGSQDIAKTQVHTFFWNTLYYLLLITCYFHLATSYLQLATCYYLLLLATHYLLLPSCYLLLATFCLLLIYICYMLLVTTYYLLLAIYHMLFDTW